MSRFLLRLFAGDFSCADHSYAIPMSTFLADPQCDIFTKMRLFSYTIPVDDGAAPNPFRGMCSLAICKPAIRRVASPGDWVVGLGSKNAPSGDHSGKVVYAMRVEEVLTLEEYDRQAPTRWPHRIPNVKSSDLAERLGDCIYDYSTGSAVQRHGVHGASNQEKDLGGMNVLISKDFFYFGNRPVMLPESLLELCHQTQSHKSNANAPYVQDFVSWIRGLGLVPGQLYGWPDFIVDWNRIASGGGCTDRDREADDENCR